MAGENVTLQISECISIQLWIIQWSEFNLRAESLFRPLIS